MTIKRIHQGCARTARARAGLTLVAGLGLVLTACSGGSGSGGGGTQTVGGAVQADLPSAARVGTGSTGSIGNAILSAGIGQASAAHVDMMNTLEDVDLANRAYCHVRALLTDPNTVLSTATITESKVLTRSLEVMRFDKFFAVGSNDGCGGAESTAFYARVDLAAFDRRDRNLTPPFSIEDIDTFALIVQFSTDGTFDDDANVGSRVGMVLASGLIQRVISATVTPSDFVDVPNELNRNMDRFTFWFDMDVLPGGRDAGDPNEMLLAVDLRNSGKRRLLAHFVHDTPAVDQTMAVDVRVEEGVGISMAMIRRDSSDVNVMRLVGPGYMVRDGGSNDHSGLCLATGDKTAVFEAWNAAGTVTHDATNQGTWTAPSGFDGWPGGGSRTWTRDYGQFLSTLFATALTGHGDENDWFEGN